MRQIHGRRGVANNEDRLRRGVRFFGAAGETNYILLRSAVICSIISNRFKFKFKLSAAEANRAINDNDNVATLIIIFEREARVIRNGNNS